MKCVGCNIAKRKPRPVMIIESLNNYALCYGCEIELRNIKAYSLIMGNPIDWNRWLDILRYVKERHKR
jgi:hypothetical protein